jgi:hypothetical protein
MTEEREEERHFGEGKWNENYFQSGEERE